MRFILFLSIVFFTAPVQARAINPLDLYGGQIEFDVVREGKVVGEHITRFSQNEDQLTVTSQMNIDIFFLIIPAYSFQYKSTEKWVSDQLISLDVKVIDGADKLTFQASAKEHALEVQLKDDVYDVAGHLFTTNHWNRDVVKDKRVLNTLTGKINEVRITPRGMEDVMISNGSIKAERYDYTGDLKDTSVWYDDKGRWVKLRFLARDGSIIEYRCRTCGQGGKS